MGWKKYGMDSAVSIIPVKIYSMKLELIPIDDYAYFDLRDRFEEEEVCLLWCAYLPVTNSNFVDLPSEILMMLMCLREAREKKLIEYESCPYGTILPDGDIELSHFDFAYYYKRKDLVKFAESLGKKPLFLFPEEREPRPPQDIATYMDRAHPMYSEELEAAVMVWRLLFEKADESIGVKKSPKNQVKEWLSQNKKDLSSEAKERIATLINPNKFKTGGPPKSGTD